MEWHPPILSFKIERHGGFVLGSSRAEMQLWNIDTANLTATVVKTSHRQMLTMAPRLNVKPIADEIRVAISEGRDDPRIKWSGANRVRILIGEVIPKTNKQTTLGRRRRLAIALEPLLRQNGWERKGHWIFEKAS